MVGMTEFPIFSLSDLLPQAEPMILLTGYEEPVSEDAVAAFVDVTEASPFYEQALGGVPGCVALEYMAQTMALLVGLYRRRKGLPPQVGFVLGSRRLEIAVPCFLKGVRYRVRATCTYQDEEFGSFDCEIRTADDGAVREGADGTMLVAKGMVTAFQPSGELTPEKMEEFS